MSQLWYFNCIPRKLTLVLDFRIPPGLDAGLARVSKTSKFQDAGSTNQSTGQQLPDWVMQHQFTIYITMEHAQLCIAQQAPSTSPRGNSYTVHRAEGNKLKAILVQMLHNTFWGKESLLWCICGLGTGFKRETLPVSPHSYTLRNTL